MSILQKHISRAAVIGALTLVIGNAYGYLGLVSFDLENATVVYTNGKHILNDNGFSFPMHYEGRGKAGAIFGKDDNDHYLRLRIDPSLGSCDVKDRSEVIIAEKVPMDSAYRYLGFRIMLPADQPHRDPQAGSFILMQVWQSSPEEPIFTMSMAKFASNTAPYHWAAGGKTGPGREGGPLLRTQVTESSKPSNLLPPFDKIGGDLRPGVWHSFVYRLKISQPLQGEIVNGKVVAASNNANIKIWKDGVVYTDSMSLPLGYWNPRNGRMDYTLKLGLYKGCETSEGDKYDENDFYAMNLDEVRFGESFDEVYPW